MENSKAVFSNVKVNILQSIGAEPKKDMIMARLGYHKGSTILQDNHRRLLELGIKEGRLLCEPKGSFARIKLGGISDEKTKMLVETLLVSKKLSELLSQSDEIVLMASTVGMDIVQRIKSEVKAGDPALGLILDAVASQTADVGLDWLMSFIEKILLKEGKKLTRYRFSPGYGDLDISNQKLIYDTLQLEKLGIEITESFMLVPEKSVLAVAGIERI